MKISDKVLRGAVGSFKVEVHEDDVSISGCVCSICEKTNSRENLLSLHVNEKGPTAGSLWIISLEECVVCR